MRLALLALALLSGCAGIRKPSPALDNARALFEAHRYGDVVSLLSDSELRTLRAKELPRGYELLGQSQERVGQAQAALRTYQSGVAQYPKDINLLTHLGNLLHTGELDEQARPFYERILKLSPANAAAHLGLAETEYRLGFLERSADHYAATIKEWKDQPKLWLDYAQVLSDRRKYGEAFDAAGKAAALSDTAAARALRAEILWKLDRRPEAFAELDAAQKLESSRIDFAQRRALWALEAGEFERANAAAVLVLNMKADDPLGLWVRGASLLRRGRSAEARRDLERAAAQKTAPFVAATAQRLLESLR
ncbi:MAG: tetratricopeptide repeat protein [Elusimicrobia bacterium]|nr:tetratricopeptide repeat protein [Elusimicrobiota bacterium]